MGANMNMFQNAKPVNIPIIIYPSNNGDEHDDIDGERTNMLHPYWGFSEDNWDSHSEDGDLSCDEKEKSERDNDEKYEERKLSANEIILTVKRKLSSTLQSLRKHS